MLYLSDFSAVADPIDEPLVIHRHGQTPGRSLIILIHGFGGSRYGTWTPRGVPPTVSGLAKFLYDDIQALDVGLYGYRTALRRLRWWSSIELEDEARVLADRIRDNATRYPVIILAGHSMGGILARAAVRELIHRGDRTTLMSVRGLLMLASPMAGSLRVPRFLWWLSADARAVRPHGPLVKSIADVFTDWVVLDEVQARPGQFVISAWVVAAAEDQWVDLFSAGLNIPSARINNVRGSHTSAVKPRTKDDDAYQWIRNRVVEIVERPWPANPVHSPTEAPVPEHDAWDQHNAGTRIPARNVYFTGRADVMIQLEEGFHSGNSHLQALVGLGGVGKTQIAVEYAHRFRERYLEEPLWARAGSRSELSQSLQDLATDLDLIPKDPRNLLAAL